MELRIKAIETDVNFAHGNIFIEATVKNAFKDFTLNRMAALSAKNTLEKYLKEALHFVPFAQKFYDFDPF